MKIVFRVDASIQIGSGHVIRCLSIADNLKRQGHSVSFSCIELPGNFISFISEKGYSITVLPFIECDISDDEYEQWLTRPETVDAHQFLQHTEQADLVIIDHYAIQATWEMQVKDKWSCWVVAIDDLVRPHQCDLIIDQTLGRKAIEYGSKQAALCGESYAILASSFCFYHEKALEKNAYLEPKRILISFGAIDADNITLKVLKQLEKVNAQITVLLSQRSPHYEAIKDFAEQHDHITHISFTQKMAALMLEHDLAIGAPGTTSWERACLGLPSIIIPIANNQRTMCQKLTQQGIALAIEANEIDQLNDYVDKLLQQWQTIHQNSLAICDGLGAFRVANAINQLAATEHGISLRRATLDDAALTFDWQQHPETRRYALNTITPTWKEHLDWFSNKLNSYSDYFYLVIKDGQAVGVVRLDRQKAYHYLVSIYIDPNCYGQGLAKAALSALDTLHPHIYIHATVLAENAASQALFKRANYQQVATTCFIRSPILEEAL